MMHIFLYIYMHLSLPLHWLRLVIRMERKIEMVNRARVGREGVKGRDLEKKYPPEKAKKLMDLLRQKGLWYWDDDFPKDEEDYLKTFENKTEPHPVLKSNVLFCS